MTFFAALKHIRSVAFSPNGQRFVSASNDCNKIWDASTFQELNTLSGHSLECVAFSPDGLRIVSGSRNGVTVWDEIGNELCTLEGHSDWVSCVAFSPDSFRIVSGSHDESIKIWNSESWDKIYEFETLKGHCNYVSSVAFSPDGQRIVSGSADRSVKIWNISGKLVRTLLGHSDSVHSVVFSPDGLCIISGSYDGSIDIWDAESFVLLHEIQTQSPIVTLSVSPDGKRIACNGGTSVNPFDAYSRVITSVDVWDAHSYEILSRLECSNVRSVAFSPNSKRILAGTTNGMVLWTDLEIFLMAVPKNIYL